MVDAFEMANLPLDETVVSGNSSESEPEVSQRPSMGGKVYGGGQAIDPEQFRKKKGISKLFSGIKKLF